MMNIKIPETIIIKVDRWNCFVSSNSYIDKEALIKSLQVLKAEIAASRSLSRAKRGAPRNDNKIKSLRAREPLAASEARREAISKLESCTKHSYSEAP